ncbi:MAG TPA: hypothetical protein VF703_15465 [Pyrinomonadaceae bacterium]|jgi:hypothetical protein
MHNSTTDKNVERRLLCAITLTCYTTTLAALLAASYSVFSLAAYALHENIFAAYSSQMF